MGSLLYVLATVFGMVYCQRRLSNIWLSSSAQWECCVCKVCSVMAPKEASELLQCGNPFQAPISESWEHPSLWRGPFSSVTGECTFRTAWWMQALAPLDVWEVWLWCIQNWGTGPPLLWLQPLALGRPIATMEDKDFLSRPHFET